MKKTFQQFAWAPIILCSACATKTKDNTSTPDPGGTPKGNTAYYSTESVPAGTALTPDSYTIAVSSELNYSRSKSIYA